ncbi:ComEA family DNA-binding protein [Thermodesulfobacteriota bacterium]
MPLKNRVGRSTLFVSFVLVIIFCLINEGSGLCQGWPDIKIRLLSNESFAVVEVATGKTMRHCPHHDLNGKLDMEQVIFCLGTLEKETWLYPENKAVVRTHLEKHYGRFAEKVMKSEILQPVNVNSARLTELVRLPQVGPVLAVKIAEYRDTHSSYFIIEDIKNVEGIGQAIFRAIRHYICTD